jgi:cysteine desulfurase
MSERVYLDWNASAPLRDEARAAVVAALDVVGNPSSVHGEGRAARAIVERARAQVSEALGAAGADIVFTSGASEAAALALAGRDLSVADVEHDAVMAWTRADLAVDRQGRISVDDPARACVQLANAETGVVQELPGGLAVTDATQAFGKLAFGFDWLGCDMALVSGHKLGAPRGVGALVVRQGVDVAARNRGGGQELGRRSGTENVAGIAGFGAAAQAAARDLANGIWERVAELRDEMEAALLEAAPEVRIFGQYAPRLANTSYFSTPGWKGETQVMAMDLAGVAVSAGSACSSGKVRASRVLRAMGHDEVTAAGAIRVSLGPTTTRDQVMRFVQVWAKAHKRYGARAA